MDLFMQQILNGLVLGSIYSLVALGLTLVYGTREIPNFAHGHLYMLGAYVTFFLITVYGFHYWPAIIGSVIVLACIGICLERVVFHPLRKAPHTNTMIASVGVMLFLESLAQNIWGADFRRLPSPYQAVYHVSSLTITQQQLLVLVATIMIMIVLQLFLKKTIIGSTIEAMAQNREGAMLVGINAKRVSMLTFAISAGLAAIAASLIAPINLIFPAMGTMVIMKSFAILVIGGMGSIPGAIVSGYILALAESLGGTYISSQYQDAFAFILLVIILTFRPTGLFSKGV